MNRIPWQDCKLNVKKLIGILVLSILQAACGGGAGEIQDFQVTNSYEQAATSQKVRQELGITALDFQEPTTPIDPADIVFEINGIGEFFNRLDLDGIKNTDDGEKDCFNNLVGNKTFQDSGEDFYTLSARELELNRCFSKNSDIFEDYFSNTYIELALVDRFGNSVDLEGRTQYASFDAYQGGLFTHEFIQMEGGATILQLGSTLDFSFTYLTSSTRDASKPCKVDPLDNIKDNCTYYSKLVVAHGSQAPNVTVAALVFNNIKITPEATYYSGGNISFSINNWEGIMTYHESNPEIPPTYFVTNGKDTITGTLGVEDE